MFEGHKSRPEEICLTCTTDINHSVTSYFTRSLKMSSVSKKTHLFPLKQTVHIELEVRNASVYHRKTLDYSKKIIFLNKSLILYKTNIIIVVNDHCSRKYLIFH